MTESTAKPPTAPGHRTERDRDPGRSQAEKPRASMETLFLRLAGCLTVDLRALFIFRIALGALLLFEMGQRSFDLAAFFTDQGLVPREAVKAQATLSVHFLSGELWYQGLLLGLAFAAALGLTVGAFPRLSALVSWFLLLSSHHRNPYILNFGDQLLLAVTLWCCFLPLHRTPLLLRPHWQGGRLAGGGVAMLLLQLPVVYWFTALLKFGADWINGSAVLKALSLDLEARPFVKGLLHFPELLEVLTYAVWVFELLGPFLLLAPPRWSRLRFLGVLGFGFMHACFMIFFSIGPFSLLCMAVLILFLPSSFWSGLKAGGITQNEEPAGSTKLADGLFDKLAVVLGGLVLYFNVLSLPGTPSVLNVAAVNRTGWELGIQQRWGMFAPSIPLEEDGWFRSELRTGSTGGVKVIDLLSDTESSVADPRHREPPPGRPR